MLRIVPLELHQANDYVVRLHRHHGAVQHLNHKFSLGCLDDSGSLVAAAIVGRPIAQWHDFRERIEVHRVCTDGTRNACSILYGAAARAAKAMGYRYIGTYTRADEPGSSLKAAGYAVHHRTGINSWAASKVRIRHDQTELFPRVYWQRRLQSIHAKQS